MGYFLTIKNELLEPKHVERMGAAVWLYMWLNDKVMAIDENGIGKVLNGRPVIFEEHIEPVLGVCKRTYVNWIKILREYNYIHTLRTPYGLVIYMTKSEKMWGLKTRPRNAELPLEDKQRLPQKRSAKSYTSKELRSKKSERSAKNGIREVQKSVKRSASNDTSNNDINKDINKTHSNNKHAKQVSRIEKSPIGVLYYKVIKAYDLPVTNHNVIWAKIKEWERELEPDRAVKYLTFLLNQYQDLQLRYKPQISTALDIYSKRAMIKNALQSEISNQQRRKIREV